jgi:hypothetical protein
MKTRNGVSTRPRKVPVRHDKKEKRIEEEKLQKKRCEKRREFHR